MTLQSSRSILPALLFAVFTGCVREQAVEEPQPTVAAPEAQATTAPPSDDALSASREDQQIASREVAHAEPGAEPKAQPEDEPASVRPSGDQVSTGEIESFVECHLKLIQLGQQMNARLQQGEPAEVLNREFKVQAQGVIEESSLSERRYMEIAKLAELDPSLRARIEAAVREMVSG